MTTDRYNKLIIIALSCLFIMSFITNARITYQMNKTSESDVLITKIVTQHLPDEIKDIRKSLWFQRDVNANQAKAIEKLGGWKLLENEK